MAALTVGLSFAVTSCKDDDNDNGNGTEQQGSDSTEGTMTLADDQLSSLIYQWCDVQSGDLSSSSLRQKTYDVTEGVVLDESRPTVRSVEVGTIEGADAYAARALHALGIDNQNPAGFSFSDAEVGTVSYKPEFSWTYEAGTKLRVLESRLTLDAALFLTSVRDQQIARFSDNGYGRMMVNAGRSRSWGAELSLKYAPVEAISAWASYGFTHATFTKYDDGTDQNYTHNYVPFIPRHTLSAGIDWKAVSSSMGSRQQSTVKFHSLTLGINTLGAGRIYWNEANSASQPIYFTFGAHAILDFGKCSINLWGRNLLDKNYHTFYFQSMGRAYAQKGHPVQVGVDLNIKLW